MDVDSLNYRLSNLRVIHLICIVSVMRGDNITLKLHMMNTLFFH